MDRIVGARWYLGAVGFIEEQNGITECDLCVAVWASNDCHWNVREQYFYSESFFGVNASVVMDGTLSGLPSTGAKSGVTHGECLNACFARI